MSSRSHSVVAAVATFIGLFAVLFVAVPTARADDKDIAQTLRAGDLVIVVRHGSTFPDQADTDPLNFDNIGAQRNLNDKGKGLAKAFGDALRQAGVPIGKVYTSKYNRAYETEREQPACRGISKDARHRTEGSHQHHTHHAHAEHYRGPRQGLVRREGR